MAVLSASTCSDALKRTYQETTDLPAFPRKLVKAAASTWTHHLFTVRQKIKGNLHITADRFVRYADRGGGRKLANDLIANLEDEGTVSLAKLQKLILSEA